MPFNRINEFTPLPTAEPLEAPRRSRQSQPPRSEGYYTVNAEVMQVSYFSSLKSQLWSLSAVLLTGIIITMLVTVVSLSRQGATWMSTSTTVINEKQIANMQAITLAKSSFVEVCTIYLRYKTSQLTLTILSELLSTINNGFEHSHCIYDGFS